jgi:hypothetical protein
MNVNKKSHGKGWLITGVVFVCLGVMEMLGSTLSDMKHPSSDYVTVGLILLLIGAALIVIPIIIRLVNRRYGDIDGDGYANDGLPATKTQRAEVLEIMKTKGAFWNPSTKMTQGEARQIIREHNALPRPAQNQQTDTNNRQSDTE